METRVIKFRAWDKREGLSRMYYLTGFIQYGEGWTGGNPAYKFYEFHYGNGGFNKVNADEFALMQFTGKKCFNDREVYEDDILFYEEETENGDRRYYLVVTWIKEWSMFATLHVSEYKKYLTEGAEALDESMFWTYTLEGCGDYHYAGNIWENPYLIRYPDDQNNLTGGQPTTEQEVP